MVFRFLIAVWFMSIVSSLYGQDTIQIVGAQKVAVVITKFDNKMVTYYEIDDPSKTLATVSMEQVVMMSKEKSERFLKLEKEEGTQKVILNGLYIEGIGPMGFGNLSYDVVGKLTEKSYLGLRFSLVLAGNKYGSISEALVLSRLKKGYIKGGLGVVIVGSQKFAGLLLDVGYRFMPKTKGMFWQASFSPVILRFRANKLPFGLAVGIAF